MFIYFKTFYLVFIILYISYMDAVRIKMKDALNLQLLNGISTESYERGEFKEFGTLELSSSIEDLGPS